MTASLLSVQTGAVAPLGPDGVPSAIIKHQRSGRITAGPLGLDGDEQADLQSHGGPEKAVYAYAAAHFPQWRARFPEVGFGAGAMGENLTIAGMTEADICVGDVHQIGTALLQACQPRQPCFKFNLLHHNNQLSAAMIQNFQSGWYYRVLEPGELGAGDAVILHHRPNPDFPFSRLVEIVYRKQGSRSDLGRMTELDGLASQWRDRAKTWLETTPSP
jgi:MOSC domain-containing protein YiiM